MASLSSQISTATSAIASAVAALDEKLLPQNCSIGSLKFCVAYKDTISCSDLPPSLVLIKLPILAGTDRFVEDNFGPLLESHAAQILFVMLFAGTIVSAGALFFLSLFYLMVQRAVQSAVFLNVLQPI